jgi:hypothetical protein
VNEWTNVTLRVGAVLAGRTESAAVGMLVYGEEMERSWRALIGCKEVWDERISIEIM